MKYAGVELDVLCADVLDYGADLLVLKHAQVSYGVDSAVVRLADVDASDLPEVGASRLIRNPRNLGFRNLLFLGVEPLGEFGYREIREFSRRALAEAAEIYPPVRELVVTMHGAGFGLDETEAFQSEMAGIIEAIDAGAFPDGLRKITLIERSQGRADRMRNALASLLGVSDIGRGAADIISIGRARRPRRIDSVGYDSAQKPHAFVAMPFAESFEDVFYFGISPPIRGAGLLCERVDQTPFAGDVLSRIKGMIESSAVVVADLSDANPNVYLELGYAWGVGRPCILICNRKTDLKFDVQGQRCLLYGSIRELEKTLSAELEVLVRSDLGTSQPR